jgi:aryl-alcohol dehydrogenase-like predicted oxidoreductase
LGTPWGSCADEATCFAILDKFVASGGNFIDTANLYAKGESERILGRWLAKHPELRSRLVIATKVRNPVDGATAGPNDLGLSRAHIMQAVEDSLARLQTPYIDLYQCHLWDAGTPVEETLRALDDLVRAGKVRYTGWSNVSGWQMMKVLAVSAAAGYTPPVSLQVQYSLLCRSTEWELTEVCEREGVGLMPWSGLKGGWLTGKMVRGVGAPAGTRVAAIEATGKPMQSHPSFTQFAEDESVWGVLEGLGDIAKELGSTIPAVALRWLLQKPSVPSLVIGCRTMEQLESNLQACAVALTPAHMARLDALSAKPAPYRACPGLLARRAARARSALTPASPPRTHLNFHIAPPFHPHSLLRSLRDDHAHQQCAEARALKGLWLFNGCEAGSKIVNN